MNKRIIPVLTIACVCNLLISPNTWSSDQQDRQPLMLASGLDGFWGAVKGAASGIVDGISGNGARPPASQTAAPQPVTEDRPLTREENREMQQRLSDLGYVPGPADGLPGKQTRSAIYAFQRDKGMYADGEPSVHLLSSLRSQTSDRARQYARRPDPVQVALGANLRAAERQLYYECAEEINIARRQENIAEIQLSRQGDTQNRMSPSTSDAVLGAMQQYGMGMLSSPEARMAAHLGRAASAQAAQAQAIQNSQQQQAAIAELQGCVARKQTPVGFQH